MSVKFLALSGTTTVTENFYVYEHGNDMIVVDCGIGFPEPDVKGVDVVLPDFSYVEKNIHKLRGVLITHAHDDHIGAVPFLLQKVKAKVYAPPLAAGFLKEKLKEHKVDADISIIDPDKTSITLGAFKITPFLVSHSVPDALGFAIDTPEGVIMHVSDYKFDWTPVGGKPFDIRKASMLSSKGVLALISDSIGSTNPGYTESEKTVRARIDSIVRGSKGRVLFTTLSSNISRMQQAIDVATSNNRKVVFVGRSMESKAKIARKLGRLKVNPKNVITAKQASYMNDREVMYLLTGAYGQNNSAMMRVASDDHRSIQIKKGDTIIFSADPAPPGTKDSVNNLVDKLILKGVTVHYYDIQEDLHVSGHGSQEDVKLLMTIANPKYYIPIGGTIRHMQSYESLAVGMGANEKNVFKLRGGGGVEFLKGTARNLKSLPLKSIFYDTTNGRQIEEGVIKDKKILSEDGAVVVTILRGEDKKGKFVSVKLSSRGFINSGDTNLLRTIEKKVENALNKPKSPTDKELIKKASGKVHALLYNKTRKKPLIVPVLISE